MEEILYMVGSAAAVTLLVGHVVRFFVLKLKSGNGRESAKLRALEAVCLELRDELRRLRADQSVALDDLTEPVHTLSFFDCSSGLTVKMAWSRTCKCSPGFGIGKPIQVPSAKNTLRTWWSPGLRMKCFGKFLR